MKRTLSIAALLVTSLAAARARADCAEPQEYTVEPSTNGSILVCMSYAPASAVTLLRQDADAGSVVQLASSCISASELLDAGIVSTSLSNLGSCCYEDACVPPGNYRYGFETPIACPNGCDHEAPYWTETTVASDLDGGCSSAAPTSYSAGAPWPNNGEQTLACSGCSCSTSRSVLGIDSVLFGVALALVLRQRKRA